jgi:hypothetical protein
VSARLTPAGRFCPYIFPRATSFAPCLISVFGPQEFLFVTLPGTAKTSRVCSSPQPAVIRVPEYSAASTAPSKCSINSLPSWDPDRNSATGRATREYELRPAFGKLLCCHLYLLLNYYYHYSIIIWAGRTVVILGMRRQGATSQRWSKNSLLKSKEE